MVAAVSSAIFMGSVNMLFLIPLQFVASKYGKRDFLFSSLLAVLLGLVLWILRRMGTDFFVPLSLLAALFVLNGSMFRLELPVWLRIVLAALLSGGGMAVSLLAIGRSEILTGLVAVLSASPEFVELLAELVPGIELEQQLALFVDILFRLVLMSSTLILLFAYGIGKVLGQRFRSLFQLLERFELPSQLIWFFIISLAVVMFGERLAIPVLIFGGWNCFLLSALLYCIRGLGIFVCFAQSKVFMRGVLPGLLLLIILLPGANVVFAAVFVILGISSIWIPYAEKI